MNKVSIALCTYNGGKFLSEQLESFLQQTRLPDELVVCDDCSSDETTEILEGFTKTAPFPVRFYVNETNLGSTKNFEKAILLCSNDLIFLSDQDDVWVPEKIEKIETEFKKNENVGMVFSDADLVDENLKPLDKRLWDFSFPPKERETARCGKILDVLIKQSTVTGATMAFRSVFRELFIPIPVGIPHLIHDEWISLVIASQSEVVFVEEPLIKYRQHSLQQLGVVWETGQISETQKSRREQYESAIRHYLKMEQKLLKMREIFLSVPKWKNAAAKTKTFELIDRFANEYHENAEHYRARQNLPTDKRRRIFPVCRELANGRYRRYSKGLLSAANDLLKNW